jgi:transposase
MRIANHLLAPFPSVDGGRDMGTRLAAVVEPVGWPWQARMGAGLLGRRLCAGDKRGSGVGNTKTGKGSKVIAVADGQGLPIGLYMDSAQPHESQLADATLATIHVPQKRRRGIKPTIPTIERCKRRRPRRGRPIKVGASYRQRWKVERCFGWMDNRRRLVVRYERFVEHYQVFCLIAIILWPVNQILK